MISLPLFKKTIKSHIRMWSIITGVLLMLIVAVFLAGSGMQGKGSMIIQQYYTLFASLLPLIYIATTANKLISQQIDNGSFAYVMANPIKRNTVSFTQALFLIISIVGMYILITIVGLISIIFIGEVLTIKTFLILNLGSMLLNLALSSISYAASCIFNKSMNSSAIGAGIPVFFFLMRMLSDFSAFSENMEYFKYLTLNTLFNVNDIINMSNNVIWQFAILFFVAALGYILGAIIFKHKDIPL